MHAIRPLFLGKEAWIAVFFGLVHGLAFAAVLTDLGLNGWYRLISLLGFNLGIESMQLVVVAATLPSLLLLSRTAVPPHSAGWRDVCIGCVSRLDGGTHLQHSA
jgi:HupE / UreJ protein